MKELNSPMDANETRTSNQVSVYRFDLFKGTRTPEGKVVKIKSVGAAFVREGLQTYTIHLKAFLKDTFYLLPNSRPNTSGDYVILTREASQRTGKKYFWNNVGMGQFLEGVNLGVMKLSWDILMADDIYMNLEPIHLSNVMEPKNTGLTVAL